MKATKKHISLKTAKFLKDCGIESKYFYNRHLANNEWKIYDGNNSKISHWESYPAYTWQEILWEYSEQFFGNSRSHSKCCIIMSFLSAKDYQEADEYFHKHCILIKNKKIKI